MCICLYLQLSCILRRRIPVRWQHVYVYMFVFTAQLHSKEEDAREVAALGVLNLAKQCSDPSALEALVKLFFAVLNGTQSIQTFLLNVQTYHFWLPENIAPIVYKEMV